MNSAAAGFGGSKWDATRDSLVGPANGANVGVVGQLEQGVEFGLLMYPIGGSTEEQCIEGQVSEQISLGNHADIRQVAMALDVGADPSRLQSLSIRIEAKA